jgi:hypothetical protein
MTYDDNDVKGIRILRGMPLTKEGFPPSLAATERHARVPAFAWKLRRGKPRYKVQK